MPLRRPLSLKVTLYCFFGVLLAPAVWYSLNTRFGLIDDYSSWTILKTFSASGGIKAWTRALLFDFGHNRFFPIHHLYNYLVWSTFGEKYYIHHFARLLLKFLTAYVSARTICLFCPDRKSFVNLGTFAFLSIYLFYPNCPEARLVPQETYIAFSFSILLFYIAKLVLEADGSINKFSTTNYISILLSFTLLACSKEPAIALTSMALCFITLLNLKLANILRIIPFAVVFAFSFCKIYSLSNAGHYGTAPISVALIKKNFLWYMEKLFLFEVSKLLIVLFLLPIGFYLIAEFKKYRTGKNLFFSGPQSRTALLRNVLMYDKKFAFYIFLIFNFLAFFGVTLTFWKQVVRYFYPLVYILALLIGFSLAHGLQTSKHKTKFASAVVICSLYFISANYYNFIYQFACQYSIRTTENRMLASVNQLLDDGHVVVSPGKSEFERNIRRYFNDYLAYFHGTSYRITEARADDTFSGNVYYVTRSRMDLSGFTLAAEFVNEANLLGLRIAKNVSSFGLRDDTPLSWVDAGVQRIGGTNWYIYRKTSIIKLK